MDKIYLSEMDLDILHKLARGMSYKQVAMAEGVAEHTIRVRMSLVRLTFGATSMPHLIAILIASAVLYLPDLYQDVDVCIKEYSRTKSGNHGLYRLRAVRV